MKFRLSYAVSLLTVSALIAGTSPAFAAGTITGSGATFASPLIDACKGDFTAVSQTVVNYPGGGSTRGQTDFKAGTLVDFAGSDAPYSSGEPENIIYAPIFAAPISIMYNVKGIKEGLYLSPTTIAKIFSGEITVWNDPEIDKDNTRTVKTPVFATKKVTTTVKGKKVTNTVPLLDSKGTYLALVTPGQHPPHLSFLMEGEVPQDSKMHRDGTYSKYIKDPSGNTVELLWRATSDS